MCPKIIFSNESGIIVSLLLKSLFIYDKQGNYGILIVSDFISWREEKEKFILFLAEKNINPENVHIKFLPRCFIKELLNFSNHGKALSLLRSFKLTSSELLNKLTSSFIQFVHISDYRPSTRNDLFSWYYKYILYYWSLVSSSESLKFEKFEAQYASDFIKIISKDGYLVSLHYLERKVYLFSKEMVTADVEEIKRIGIENKYEIINRVLSSDAYENQIFDLSYNNFSMIRNSENIDRALLYQIVSNDEKSLPLNELNFLKTWKSKYNLSRQFSCS